MSLYWQRPGVSLYHADARKLPLPDQSVHAVVTSPPYFGLRNYGTPGGIGLEASFDEYLENVVLAMGEVWRVLRDDGVCYLNLGDIYVGSGKGMHLDGSHSHGLKQQTNRGSLALPVHRRPVGLKPKNLLLLPFRVASALQDDGWILRDDIVWHKLNPMTEAVRDRPTRAHEFVLMLVKSYRPTFWLHRDGRGARSAPVAEYLYMDRLTGVEQVSEPPNWSREKIPCPTCKGAAEIAVQAEQPSLFGEASLTVSECQDCWNASDEPGRIHRFRRVNCWSGHDYFWDSYAVRQYSGDGWHSNRFAPRARERRPGERRQVSRDDQRAGANIRDVWPMSKANYRGAHHATFPEALVELCLLPSVSAKGVCAACGAPWARVLSATGHRNSREACHVPNGFPTKTDSTGWKPTIEATNDWQPSCECGAGIRSGIVLDPFAGSGTTCLVARRLGMDAIGVDLSLDYLEVARDRLERNGT